MPVDIPRRTRFPRRGLARALGSLLLAALVTLAAPSAYAERVPAQAPEVSSAAGNRFELQQSAQSVPVDGDLRLAVRSTLTTDAPYLEVRFQVLRPGGGVMLQKTEIRHDVAPGTQLVVFERELASLGLRPDTYPVNVRIRYSDRQGRTHEDAIEDLLFLYDPEHPPTPVSLVVRLNGITLLDSEGRFVQDPAQDATERDIALALADGLANSGGRFSLAVPPLVLDEWRRASGAYEVAEAAGVRKVPADTPSAVEYARALSSVAALARLERVELLDVPYADPDLIGMQSIDAIDDLARHYERGASSYLASLEQTPTAGTVVRQNRLTPSALPVLARQGVSFAMVSPASLVEDDRDTASGVYRSGEATTALLVPDEDLATKLVKQPAEALRRLYERRQSEEPTVPAVVVLELGRGRSTTPADVVRILRTLDQAPWIETVTASEAAEVPTKERVRVADGRPGDEVPAGYWRDVADGRRWALALSAAAGERDRDAEAAWYGVMLAESGSWAGADGSWSLADRGRAFAAAAERRGQDVLGKVGLETQDVTLSGRDGEVPVSLSNDTGRPLQLTLRLESSSLAFPGGSTRAVRVPPADNYLTFPVDLRSALSGTIRVTVVAGDLVLDEAQVEVQASYLDRIALVSAVVIVLVAMLFFIKRRVDRADADIIESRHR